MNIIKKIEKSKAKLSRTFLEFITETRFFEMAETRKKIKKKVDSLSEPIILYLVKVLYYEDKLNYNKYINDIDIWLNKLYMLECKPNSRVLSTEDYYEWLYEGSYNSLNVLKNRIINRQLKEYNELPIITSINELHIKLGNIYKQLSVDLHTGDFNTIKDYI